MTHESMEILASGITMAGAILTAFAVYWFLERISEQVQARKERRRK